MKVAVFGAKKYDKDSFESANDLGKIEFTYLDARLDAKTAILAADHEAVCIFVNDQCDEEVLGVLKDIGVKYIALRCAGFNNIDLQHASSLGLQVVRVPAYSPVSVAEFAVGMMLTIIRKYHKSYLRVREGNFLLDGLTGFNLSSKVIGIIGTGKIGLLTGKILAKGFGCKVLAYDLYRNEETAREYGIQYTETLRELLEEADVVSLHCPLTEGENGTRHMINRERLTQMKKGAVLVNTSRGGLVDTVDLIWALKTGHLGAVGLDVYENESAYFFADSSSKIIHDDNFARLLSFYNVFVSGHQAFLTEEALLSIAHTTIQNLLDLQEKGECLNECKPEK
ncbi:D-lactate dehydrogenase [Pyronema omphalodes]|nr:D-lactate dehydrogenase [Pyronema omphalodes]